MGLSTWLYVLLLAGVALGRLIELSISRRRLRALAVRGAEIVAEPSFHWLVLVHAGVLAGSALEVVLLKRPVIPVLAMSAGILFLLANGLRWWVIYTLADHWNVHVVDSLQLGVVTGGPFRWLRHPNYLAVIVELEALPLLHTAWLTALLGGAAHSWVLGHRIATEEAMLMRNPAYRESMGLKSRFLPRIRRLPRIGRL